MIAVTGAGALNGATVEHLLGMVPVDEIAVVVRDPGKARRFAERGVTVRHGDYAAPESLPAAFEGADQLLLVSTNDPMADAVALHRNAIDAAVTAGVGRILYTSLRRTYHQPCRPGRCTLRLAPRSGEARQQSAPGGIAHPRAV